MSPRPDLVVASFNVHAGVDGWGRPWDVVEGVRSLEADVVVLQEVWSPADGPSTAQTIGSSLGYRVFERSLARGRRATPHPGADHRWMRSLDWRGEGHALYLNSERPLPGRVLRSARFGEAEPGSWGIAVLSRLPVVSDRVIDLGRLPRDRVTRAALVLQVDVGGRPLTVIGTHMSHLTYGSPAHFLRLQRVLRDLTDGQPSVLAGDMNLWGPPTSLFFGEWRRAVSGRTWPSWRPHSQIDHILVRGPVTPAGGTVMPACGSDHLAVRAHLTLT
ncbi:MAG TPA: endonuclease/exonuclease/phosphatase family protein [Acidimicrobiales bacterium]|nr:endonuclease/exonuclease/phosphatase family protein [Acidimicrobiales bacterium]